MKKRRHFGVLLPVLLVAMSLLGVAGGPAGAAPGDAVLVVDKPAACGGIGVAFDGADVLYTCGSETAIRKMDLTGADTGFLATVDTGGNPLSVDAIGWDPDLSKIWGGDLSGGSCRIWTIDPVTGIGTLEFSFVDPHGGCDFFFYDGLAVDTVDDTLWLSPDVHSHIHHYNKDGTEIAADLIDFAALTPAGEPDVNSGLAIGLDGQLFAATASNGKIFQIDTTTSPPSFVGQFASSAGRDEDLECGPEVTKSDGSTVETILSVDFDTIELTLFEAPDGTCQSPVVVRPGEIRLDPQDATNEAGSEHTVTAIVTSGGNPLPGRQVSFKVVSGPNTGQVSDPGECSIDPNCITDLNGQTSWTYTSNGQPGPDIIEGCFIDDSGAERCARALKRWVDTTGPEAACVETDNPHGDVIPPAGSTTLPGSKGGQNEDGFYRIFGKDSSDPNPHIDLIDGGSGFVYPGPFATGDRVKYTEANGADPSQKEIGSSNGEAGAVRYHLTGKGDLVLVVTDASGNTTTVSCLVPPPPK